MNKYISNPTKVEAYEIVGTSVYEIEGVLGYNYDFAEEVDFNDIQVHCCDHIPEAGDFVIVRRDDEGTPDDVYLCPKSVFDEKYMNLDLPKTHEVPPHQRRVLDEAEQLKDKIDKLEDFINNNPMFTKLSMLEKSLLRSQIVVMRDYFTILSSRIDTF